MHTDIEKLADRLVALRFEHEPLEGAMLGLDDGCAGLADIGRESHDHLVRHYREVAVAAEALSRRFHVEGVQLEEREVVTLDLVDHASSVAADELSLNLIEMTVSGFANSPAVGLVSVLPQLPLGTSSRRDAYLARLAGVPRFLEQLAQRHLDGSARGLTPTSRGVANAVHFLDEVLADPQLAGLRRECEDAAFDAAQDALVTGAVAPALSEYRTLLADRLVQRGRDDDHPGLWALEDGAALYEVMTRVWTSTARTPAELHQTGLAMIEGLRGEFRTVGRRLWGTEDVVAIHDRLRNDPDLRYGDAQEMLEAAKSTVRRAEAAAPAWFATVPSSACAVEPVPDALAPSSAAAYYFPGALDGSRPGTYFINTSRPAQSFRHVAEAIAFHEAVPGHHFQLTLGQQIANGHLVQSVFSDGATTEGWGLYAERLADEMGLYSGDLALLGMLSTDTFRAARLVVDTGLHAFEWSRSQAIDWMSENVPISHDEVVAEVDRYISMPGQALSYMVGRLEIESLRSHATAKLAEGFDLRDFHDMILSTGPVPLHALAGAVHRWVARRASPMR